MDSQALALQAWQHVTLGLALELAIGSAYFLFVALMSGRRLRDIVLALPLLAASVWMVQVSAGMRTQASSWSSYLRFVTAHYPSERYPALAAQTKADYNHALAGATHLGWAAVAVTEGGLLLSLVLMRRWLAPRRGIAPVVAPPLDADDMGNELEIVVEPLGVEGGDVTRMWRLTGARSYRRWLACR